MEVPTWKVNYIRRTVPTVCKSPIEEKLLEAYLLQLADEDIDFKIINDEPSGVLEMRLHDMLTVQDFVVIIPQAPVEKYKVDFMVAYYGLWSDFPDGGDVERVWIRRTPFIAIECDGHDFHEKTKEQAAHDKSRDRRLAALGYQTLRFTGSEIFRNPGKCVAEIEDVLVALMGKW